MVDPSFGHSVAWTIQNKKQVSMRLRLHVYNRVSGASVDDLGGIYAQGVYTCPKNTVVDV